MHTHTVKFRSAAVATLVLTSVFLVGAAPPASARPASLRDLADAKGMIFGSAAEYPALSTNPGGQYRDVLGRQFNELTPGNEMKWDTIHPSQNVYDFTKADALVAFARNKNMKVRGHTLVWHQQNPAWLESFSGTRDDWIALLQNHIATVVGHYRGQIAQWDVVNEAFDGYGNMRLNLWRTHIGADYVKIAFDAAHAADPAALLYLNDYGAEGPGGKFDGIFNFVASQRSAGVPINGVGFQAHLISGVCAACASNLAANMARLNSIGVDVAITELDVRILLPVTALKLKQQADLYGGEVGACVAAPNCHTVVVWGFTDLDSWIPQFFPAYGAACLYDENYQPKPAVDAVRAQLLA
jgi:endo-1,4-beta-xylanase